MGFNEASHTDYSENWDAFNAKSTKVYLGDTPNGSKVFYAFSGEERPVEDQVANAQIFILGQYRFAEKCSDAEYIYRDNGSLEEHQSSIEDKLLGAILDGHLQPPNSCTSYIGSSSTPDIGFKV